MKWLMFSKMFGSLSVEETGEIVADMGFDGVELTVYVISSSSQLFCSIW